MSIILQNIAKNIKNRRLSAGLSQAKLAELAKMSLSFISTIERSPKNVRIESLEELARALNCSINDLVNSAESAQISSRKRARKSIKDDPVASKESLVGLQLAINILKKTKDLYEEKHVSKKNIRSKRTRSHKEKT